MDPDTYLSVLAAEGAALAAAAEGHLDRPVRTCPEWDVAQLVTHMGGVHAWVRKLVAAGGERVGPREAAIGPEEGRDLLDWYREGVAQLVEALSVDPDTPAWTFSRRAPDTVAWWRRRQALETAVHRWDAQTAESRGPDPVATELAVDGIDELLVDFLPGILSARPVDGLTGTFHAHATDTTGEWWLDFDAPEVAARREHAKADTAVRGPASGLYLWMWNRQSPDEAGLEVFGRAATVPSWRAITL
jgi:uncharacterized protein (TIGR03083 family)